MRSQVIESSHCVTPIKLTPALCILIFDSPKIVEIEKIKYVIYFFSPWVVSEILTSSV